MRDIVIFHLAKYFPPRTMKPCDMADSRTLYNRIKDGSKTSEWRDMKPYWIKALCWDNRAKDGKFGSVDLFVNGERHEDISFFLKVHKAWFVTGYPKGNLPRLETEIVALVYHPDGPQLEIQFGNVQEVNT